MDRLRDWLERMFGFAGRKKREPDIVALDIKAKQYSPFKAEDFEALLEIHARIMQTPAFSKQKEEKFFDAFKKLAQSYEVSVTQVGQAYRQYLIVHHWDLYCGGYKNFDLILESFR